MAVEDQSMKKGYKFHVFPGMNQLSCEGQNTSSVWCVWWCACVCVHFVYIAASSAKETIVTVISIYF